MGRYIPYIRAFVFLALGFIVTYFLLSLVLSAVLRISGTPVAVVKQTNLYYGRDNSVIARDYVDENRYWIPLSNMSPSYVDATLSIEDQHFYEHNGFDYPRIIGALIADIKAMKKVQGASTITQQLAKNLYLTPDKTWSRKFFEAIYTMRLETNQKKDEILESYLNTIYFGFGTYGVEAASQYYFGKHASALSLAESAMLAGIPKGPATFSPFLQPENAKKRQILVLTQMKKQHKITEKEFLKAKSEQLRFNTKKKTKEVTLAPYFIDAVKQRLQTEAGLTDEQISTGGLRIYTTLDPVIQQQAEEIVTKTLSSTSLQSGILLQQPKTGEILGLIGGTSYEHSQFNRVTQALRQPGSTIKPLLYYTALENGYTPTTALLSEKTSLEMDELGDRYTPSNASKTYANRQITLLEALALSDNIYAVKTLQAVGHKQFARTLSTFGITTPLEKVPASALGSSPVKHLELTNAYSMIANGGTSVTPSFIKRIEDYEGNLLYEASSKKDKKLKADSTFILNNLMKGMFNPSLNSYTTVTGANIASRLHHDYAGKTGSTKTDSWMIGFTPTLVASVWVGYDDNRPLTTKQDYQYAKQMWASIMEDSLPTKKERSLPKPKNVVAVKIDPFTGLLATPYCPVEEVVYFQKGEEPTDFCDKHLKPEKKNKEIIPTKKSPFHFLAN